MNIKKYLFPLALCLAGLILILLGQSFPFSKPPEKPSLIASSPSPSSVAVLAESGEEVLVSRVIDGDTIELKEGEKVRYIGIDTPETVDPHRVVGCFGKEASDENKKLVEGKLVYLVKDTSEIDKFGRLLRYVYLKETNKESLFVNDFLVRFGFAKADPFPPDLKFKQEFQAAESEAKQEKRGLWEKCFPA